MFRSVLRHLLTLYMLLALLGQGYAQAAMVTCALGSAAPSGMAQAAGMPHDHAAMLAAMQQQPAAQDAASPQVHHVGHDQAGHDGHAAKCKHCAPCCVGAALVGDISLAVAAPLPAQAFPSTLLPAESAERQRLERPPQPVLA